MRRRAIISTVGFSLGIFGILLTNRPDYISPSIHEAAQDGENAIEVLEPNSETLTSAPQLTSAPTPTSTDVDATETVSTPSSKPVVSTSPLPTAITKLIIDGDVASAGKYGSVQVRITVLDGAVISASALIFPDADSRSLSISNMAIPILVEQTIEARDSADIQGATGASYTSSAWIESLQSALSSL